MPTLQIDLQSVFIFMFVIFLLITIYFDNKLNKNHLTYIKNSNILDCRDRLLDKMQDNQKNNVAILRSYIGSKNFYSFLEFYEKNDKVMWETWKSISYEMLKESDEPVDSFYGKEVQAKLFWKFIIISKDYEMTDLTLVH